MHTSRKWAHKHTHILSNEIMHGISTFSRMFHSNNLLVQCFFIDLSDELKARNKLNELSG